MRSGADSPLAQDRERAVNAPRTTLPTTRLNLFIELAFKTESGVSQVKLFRFNPAFFQWRRTFESDKA